MAELKFVIKCVFMTAILMVALQFEVEGVRTEKRVSDYLRDGKVVVWVRESVKGAHHFVLHNGKEIFPKLMAGNWLPSWGSKTVEPLRNISSDLPLTDFPDDEIGEDLQQKASAF